MPPMESTAADVLDAAPPLVAEGEAMRILVDDFGIRAHRLTRLASERDTNFRVEAENGPHVLKFANPREAHDVTRLQTAALQHLENAVPGLPVPRVRRTRAGASETFHAGSMVRVLSWLEGLPLHMSSRSPAQGKSLGQSLGQLTRGLAAFSFNGGEQDLQWDIRHTLRLASRLDAVSPAWRPAIEQTLSRFAEHAAPQLAHLRQQFVHNDLNPFNVLVDPADEQRLSGILDFGDMVKTPLICDVGVAAAYMLLPGHDPLACITPFLAAYHSELPLAAREISILPELVLARLATTIVITSWRAEAYPENRDYILRNAPAAMAGLAALSSIPREEIIAHVHRAIGMEAT